MSQSLIVVALFAATLLLLVVVAVVDADLSSPAAEQPATANDEWSDHWVVEVPGGKAAADRVASRYGFRNVKQLFDGVYFFKRVCNGTTSCVERSRRSDLHTQSLLSDQEVTSAEQQKILVRRRRTVDVKKRDVSFNDPQWTSNQQWFLYQPNGQHINVKPVWAKGITGQNVTVSVVDDGMEHTHDDLVRCYDPASSYDENGGDPDPYPNEADPINKHGTRCSGQIGMQQNNNKCGVGIAWDAKVGAVRMLDGVVTDAVESASLQVNISHVQIYTSSWGPNDDGVSMEGPGPQASRALELGVSTGRGGKGAIYLFANGNGGQVGDNCNADGYSNSIYTIAIGAISSSGTYPWYSEQCPCVMAVTYSSGSGGQPSIATVDLGNRCTTDHTGTSAAAPMAAGILALVLAANQNLTWRDVQHVIAHAAQKNDPDNSDWVTTTANLHVHYHYGFGNMDANQLVSVAQTWQNVPPQQKLTTVVKTVGQAIPYSTNLAQALESTLTVTPDMTTIRSLEHVQLIININAQRRGDLEIVLLCPSGTQSVMLSSRPHDYTASGIHFTFMTVRCWDESPIGNWNLFVRNAMSQTHSSELVDWQLVIYGHQGRTLTCITGQYLQASDNTCQPCDAQCSDRGCHGAGPDHCVSCATLINDNTCVAACPAAANRIADPETNRCVPCDSECAGGCTGLTPFDCVACVHETKVVNGRAECVTNCSSLEYIHSNGSCLPCHAECADGCVGPDPDDCEACLHYVTGNHTCVAACPVNTYLEVATQRCKVCDPECSAQGCDGPGPLNCIACAHYHVQFMDSRNHSLIDTECVNTCPVTRIGHPESHECVCPQNFFPIAGTVQCSPCHAQCANDSSCVGPTASDCGRCESTQYKNECVAVCPPMSYNSSQVDPNVRAQFQCRQCHVECASGCVGPTAADCVNGSSGRCVHAQVNTTCVTACPTGTYLSNQTTSTSSNGSKVCLPCDSQCVAANGCSGPGPSACVRCAVARDAGVCVTQCPAKKFKDRSNQCQNCNSECALGCTGPLSTNCTNNACMHVSEGGACVAACSSNTYLDNRTNTCLPCNSLCDGCTGPALSQCTDCDIAVESGLCVSGCSPNHYINDSEHGGTASCWACDSSCTNGCLGPGPQGCFVSDCSLHQCAPDYTMTADCQCVYYECLGYQYQNRCIPACPKNTVADGTKTCVPCDAECAEGCTGPTPSDCVKCQHFLAANGTCVAACNDNEFLADNSINCTACDPECIGCTGPLTSDCLVCQNYLFDGHCVATCPNDTTYGDPSGECRLCNHQCKGCTGPNPTDCIECNAFKLNGVCVDNCPALTYSDDTNTCMPCYDQCALGCIVDAVTCIKDVCVNMRLETGHCVEVCPFNTYPDSGVCRRCNTICNDGCYGGNQNECLEPISTLTTPPSDINFPKGGDGNTGPDGVNSKGDGTSRKTSSGAATAGIVVLVLLCVGVLFFFAGKFGVGAKLSALLCRRGVVKPNIAYTSLANDEDDRFAP